MRKLLILLLIPIAALPVCLAEEAVQQNLAADLSKAIVVWRGSVVIYKSGAGPHNTAHAVYVGAEDVQRLLSMCPDCSTFYVVVRVIGVDPYGPLGRQVPPRMRVIVYRPEITWGNYLYGTDWVMVSNPGIYTFVVPREILEQVENRGFRLVVELLGVWNTDPNSGAKDTFYGVRISEIALAPPKVATSSGSDAISIVTQPMSESIDRKVVVAAIGAGIVGLGIGVAVAMFARRRW